MTKKEAEKLVQTYLEENEKDFSVVPESTIESKSCFAVFYQSNEFLKTKKFEDITVGQGPTIVSKNDR
ncbi:YrhB domain-containing protein [uncultured Tenacibaculum sp.]|uniref:YrhB domain-containing protein n=1 Tax=uncultured Tenacibaculum sp. TaxID=174713 RepID=UPI00260C0BD0|nr:YrhB domain-containing protein [uncultured Tenacibaculum sp.]